VDGKFASAFVRARKPEAVQLTAAAYGDPACTL
jgi:hypothetical protein